MNQRPAIGSIVLAVLQDGLEWPAIVTRLRPDATTKLGTTAIEAEVFGLTKRDMDRMHRADAVFVLHQDDILPDGGRANELNTWAWPERK